ncbi:MAG: FG-GAP repeat protein, partial [Desulfobacterota bacterium]|nr:FG-GAP repeat protein [Thermodesulfobacteriota bacterium]
SNSASPLASFVPYLPGEYGVRLVVNDGAADSPDHIMTVSVAYPPFSLTEEKLTAGDGAAGNRFGSSLSIDNYRAIIGSEGKEAAYIFESQSPWAEKARLVSGKAGDGFGSAVSVSGDYALAGAHGDDDLGIDSGAAYLFRFDDAQWSRLPKLTADDGKAGDFFGASIALSSDLAVVGAPGDDTNDGNWVQRFAERKYLPLASGMSWNTVLQQWENRSGLYILEANSADGWARNFRPLAIRVSFGALSSIPMLRVVGTNSASLAYSNNYLLRQPLPLSNAADIRYIYVSNPPAVTNIEFLVPSTKGAVDAGSVYVFKRGEASWLQQAKLTASDGAEGDAFGVSVAVSDQTIIVGAEGDDDYGQDSGSAYLFYQNGTAWVEEAKLLAKNGKMGDRFGSSVALSGNVAVVGAPHPNVADGEPGSACVFRFNGEGWIEEARLTALDGKAGDRFGASVSISADYIVVGAPGAGGSGAYYVFKFDGSEWNLKGKGVPTDKADGQEFGGAVSISGDVILSGAAGDSEKADQAGAAYAHSIDTYHTAGIHANPDITKAGLPTELSWSWVNAMVVQIDPGIGVFDVTGTATGSGGAEVSPDVTTTYRITAYGPYGKDVASVTVFVEP